MHPGIATKHTYRPSLFQGRKHNPFTQKRPTDTYLTYPTRYSRTKHCTAYTTHSLSQKMPTTNYRRCVWHQETKRPLHSSLRWINDCDDARSYVRQIQSSNRYISCRRTRLWRIFESIQRSILNRTRTLYHFEDWYFSNIFRNQYSGWQGGNEDFSNKLQEIKKIP